MFHDCLENLMFITLALMPVDVMVCVIIRHCRLSLTDFIMRHDIFANFRINLAFDGNNFQFLGGT